MPIIDWFVIKSASLSLDGMAKREKIFKDTVN